MKERSNLLDVADKRGADNFPRLRAPKWWRDLARKEIRAQYGSQAKVAAAIGGSQAGVSLAVHPNESVGSTYIIPLSQVLDIPMPTGTFEDESIARLMDEAAALGPDSIRILRDMAKALGNKSE